MSRVSSIYTGSAVDGPGVRTVVFFQGCPLRCVYCHNPETQSFEGGEEYTPQELFEKIKRYNMYYGENGGVTFSGGEALCAGKFLCEVLKLCRDAGINTAIDTSGCINNSYSEEAVRLADLIILDIKMNNEEDYKKYIGGSFKETIKFLDFCEQTGTDVWIRKVIVPGINDNEECILGLKKIVSGYKCIKKTELLPFERLCAPKYEKLGMEFPLADTPAMDKIYLDKLKEILMSGI